MGPAKASERGTGCHVPPWILSLRAPQLNGSKAVKRHYEPPRSAAIWLMSSSGSPLKPTGMAELHVSSAPEAGQVYGGSFPIQHSDLLPPLPCNIFCLPGAGESFPAAVTPRARPACTPRSQLSISQGSIREKTFLEQRGGIFGRQVLLQQGKQGTLQELRSPLHHPKTAASIQGQSGVPRSQGEGRDAKGPSSSQEH